jgi:diguanylate cyclase
MEERRTASLAAWLKKVEILSGFEEKELRSLAAGAGTRRYRPDACVFREGSPATALYVVMSGRVRICREDSAGAQDMIAELVSGDSFGEFEMLSSAVHSATARAAEEASLLVFPGRGKSLEVFFEEQPAMAARIVFESLKAIAGRIRKSNSLVKDNSPWVQELRRQVYTDKLTGLYNRTYLEEELPGRLANADRRLALLMMKPDNFKQINDSFGHEAGDESLKLMAVELRRHLLESEPAVKYMGNALAVCLPGAGRESALEKAREIRAAFNALDLSALTGGGDFRLSVSIGIALFPEHERAPDRLIAAAESLPLLGRSRGGNQILFPEDAA